MQTIAVAMPKDHTRTRATWLLALPFLWFAAPTFCTYLAGGAVAMVGVAIRAWAAGTVQKNLRLATAGPYAFVRHPLYLGGLLIGLGLTLAGGIGSGRRPFCCSTCGCTVPPSATKRNNSNGFSVTTSLPTALAYPVSCRGSFPLQAVR